MTLAIDTDVLVNWAMSGASRHRAARQLIETESDRPGGIGLIPQVLFEFVHIVTDRRRFERPLTMEEALRLVRELWDAPEVVRIIAGTTVLHRTVELLTLLRLGRKRILDTALAATLEEAGVSRLATFNRRDFEAFSFLEVVSP